MKSNIELDIIKRISRDGNQCFTLEDTRLLFPNKSDSHLVQVLTKMVRKGMIKKLNRGMYYIVPLDQDSEYFIPDWHLVARHLMRNKKYYIGYYSAMQIHGLITQPSLTEIIVTDTQVKPSIKKIQGVKFQFVYHNFKRFFGEKNTWIDDHNKVMCSTIEKTITDSLINPHYSGGIVEIGKAMYECKDRINAQQLIQDLIRTESKVALKRYLFLYDLLELGDKTVYHYNLENMLGNSISLLDTSAPDEGNINSRYALKINRDIETIKDSIFT